MYSPTRDAESQQLELLDQKHCLTTALRFMAKRMASTDDNRLDITLQFAAAADGADTHKYQLSLAPALAPATTAAAATAGGVGKLVGQWLQQGKGAQQQVPWLVAGDEACPPDDIFYPCLVCWEGVEDFVRRGLGSLVGGGGGGALLRYIAFEPLARPADWAPSLYVYENSWLLGQPDNDDDDAW